MASSPRIELALLEIRGGVLCCVSAPQPPVLSPQQYPADSDCCLANGGSLVSPPIPRHDTGCSYDRMGCALVPSLLGGACRQASPGSGDWCRLDRVNCQSQEIRCSQVIHILRLCPDWSVLTSGGPNHLHNTGIFFRKYLTLQAHDPETWVMMSKEQMDKHSFSTTPWQPQVVSLQHQSLLLTWPLSWTCAMSSL